MAAGDITATTTAYETMALLNAALDALSTGGATRSRYNFLILLQLRTMFFYLTKMVQSWFVSFIKFRFNLFMANTFKEKELKTNWDELTALDPTKAVGHEQTLVPEVSLVSSR